MLLHTESPLSRARPPGDEKQASDGPCAVAVACLAALGSQGAGWYRLWVIYATGLGQGWDWDWDWPDTKYGLLSTRSDPT